jgi:hypothetical protein
MNQIFGLQVVRRTSLHVLIICDVLDDSPSARWNASNPRLLIRAGHVIKRVNNSCNVEDMVKSLSTCTDVELEVATPAYYAMLSASFKQFLDQTVSPSYLESLPYLSAAECNVYICTICMEDCSPNTKLLQLPCGHAYHRSCATKWFTRRSRRCPLCARVLPMSMVTI